MRRQPREEAANVGLVAGDEKGEAVGEPMKVGKTISDIAWIIGGATLAIATSAGNIAATWSPYTQATPSFGEHTGITNNGTAAVEIDIYY